MIDHTIHHICALGGDQAKYPPGMPAWRNPFSVWNVSLIKHCCDSSVYIRYDFPHCNACNGDIVAWSDYRYLEHCVQTPRYVYSPSNSKSHHVKCKHVYIRPWQTLLSEIPCYPTRISPNTCHLTHVISTNVFSCYTLLINSLHLWKREKCWQNCNLLNILTSFHMFEIWSKISRMLVCVWLRIMSWETILDADSIVDYCLSTQMHWNLCCWNLTVIYVE